MQTKANWRDLPEGRELDAFVAERVLGWTFYEDDDESGWRLPDSDEWAMDEHDDESLWDNLAGRLNRGWDLGSDVPLFSSTWQGMSLVIEALEKREWALCLDRALDLTTWDASFVRRTETRVDVPGAVTADSAPLAVCRAALAALEVA